MSKVSVVTFVFPKSDNRSNLGLSFSFEEQSPSITPLSSIWVHQVRLSEVSCKLVRQREISESLDRFSSPHKSMYCNFVILPSNSELKPLSVSCASAYKLRLLREGKLAAMASKDASVILLSRVRSKKTIFGQASTRPMMPESDSFLQPLKLMCFKFWHPFPRRFTPKLLTLQFQYSSRCSKFGHYSAICTKVFSDISRQAFRLISNKVGGNLAS